MNEEPILTHTQEGEILLNILTDAIHKVSLFDGDGYKFVIEKLIELKNQVRLETYKEIA